MEILEVDSKAYAEALPNPSNVFNSAAFSELNASKCDAVYYLLFKDSKVRLGIIFGVRNNILTSPFSAPFGGFEAVSSDIRLQQIDAAIAVLHAWVCAQGFRGTRIVFPPFFYNSNTLNKIYNCLSRKGFERKNVDLNYQFHTANFNEDYTKTIWYNAQKNLKRSLGSGLTFEKISNDHAEYAYRVISLNRSSRGFPLRMTFEQVLDTGRVIDIDYFIVRKEESDIAAAIVFHVAQDIVQVVYWGDLPEYSECKTMNFLSYHIFQYYKNQGIKVVDIGPSSENSIPNYGLCEFKEGVGCDISLKSEFYLETTPLSVNTAPASTENKVSGLIDIDAKEYQNYFPSDPNPFISEGFISLNANKVDRIVRLVQDADKVQLGLVAGIKGHVLLAPFSAPFGGFHHKGESIYTSVIESFVSDLQLFALHSGIKEIRITVPPDLYNNRINAKLTNVLMRKGFQTQIPDITNHIDLKRFKNVYTHNSSRTYYNQALKKGLVFAETKVESEKRAIYDLIVENRIRMGRPIHMTYADVVKTTALFPTDFFKISNVDQEIIAGAIMYRFHKEIVYALLWGDDLRGRSDRAMDFLIFNLWSHFKAIGFHYIDLGISTVEGIPNEGLLRFKETHECQSSLRFSLKWLSENA
jgi:hypothetical protein